MLSLHPFSGYDIRKKINDGLFAFWGESYGQIYTVLSKLEWDGLITRRQCRQECHRDKILYAITADGRKDLMRYLKLPIENHVVRDEMALKFAFSFNASIDQTVELLKEESLRCEAQLKLLRQKRSSLLQTGSLATPYVLLLIDLAESQMETKIRWCKTVASQLRKKRPQMSRK